MLRMGIRVKVPPSAINWSATTLPLYRDAAAVAPTAHSAIFLLARFPIVLTPCAASPGRPEKTARFSRSTPPKPSFFIGIIS